MSREPREEGGLDPLVLGASIDALRKLARPFGDAIRKSEAYAAYVLIVMLFVLLIGIGR